MEMMKQKPPRNKPAGPAGEDDLFERMGRVYKLLVNERSRHKKEAPFLLATAEQARISANGRKKPRERTRILDLGCGTGFHSRLFARAGYPVTGMDRSESMLVQARKRKLRGKGAGRLDFRHGDLLKPLPVARPAALTLILGNTLSTFQNLRQVQRVLEHAAAATCAGGWLLCQTLNYERFKAAGAGQTVTRHAMVDKTETVLTKVLQPVFDGGMLITMTVSQKNPDNTWTTASKVSQLLSIKPAPTIRRAEKTGLDFFQLYGDIAGSNFCSKNSTDTVLLFRKSI